MKAIKDNIKKILKIKENYFLKDDRQNFVWEYYKIFHREVFEGSFYDFALFLNIKSIPSIATLERLWRMVQMENPELRGSEWNKRQRQVKPVQKDLGYNIKK